MLDDKMFLQGNKSLICIFFNILAMSKDADITDEYSKTVVHSYDWTVIVYLFFGILILVIILTSIPVGCIFVIRRQSSKKILSGSPYNSNPESETSTLCDTDSQFGMSFFQRIENFKNRIPNYKMNYPRRGLAIVFNHKNFDNKSQQRNGTNIDRKSIKATLKKLDFEVRIYDDESATKIMEILENVRKENHYDADCICVVVLSHGGEGIVSAKDETYEIKKLWEPFTADRCPSLAGKPKLFLFQVSYRNTIRQPRGNPQGNNYLAIIYV